MQNSPMALEKLFPKETKVKLGNLEHEFTVRKLTLEVDAWMKIEFGSAEIAAGLLQAGDPETLMKLFYKLLSNEDKLFLKEIKIEDDMDEEGNVIYCTNQVKKLLILCSIDDVKNIFTSLINSRGVSLPEGFGDDENKGKKKAQVKKK